MKAQTVPDTRGVSRIILRPAPDVLRRVPNLTVVPGLALAAS